MTQVLSSAPGTEPVTLAEARTHLRIDDANTADDTYIGTLIQAARERIETFCKRALVTQTWLLYLPEFPEEIQLPMGDVQSVTSIQYTDTDGNNQTLDTSVYQTDLAAVPATIKVAYGQSWPGTRAGAYNAVTVTYVAGYGAASAVPQPLKQAILLIIGHLYENRETVSTGVQMFDVPHGAESLAWPYRVDVV